MPKKRKKSRKPSKRTVTKPLPTVDVVTEVFDRHIATITDIADWDDVIDAMAAEVARRYRVTDGVIDFLNVELAHCDDLFWLSDTRGVPKCEFFTGGEFRIELTPTEVEGRYLITGHRFAGLLPTSIPPQEIIVTDADGKPLPTRDQTFAVEDIRIHHSLLGSVTTGLYFTACCFSKNMEPETGSVPLTIHDLSDILPEGGSTLMGTVVDWREGRVTLRALEPKSVIDFAGTHSFCKSLDDAFIDTFNSQEEPLSIQDQIQQAYLRAGETVLQNPPLHLGGYLAQSDSVQITPYGLDTMLWLKGQDPADMFGEGPSTPEELLGEMMDGIEDVLEEMGGEYDSQTDELFDCAGLDLYEMEAIAYCLDGMFRGTTREESLSRIFALPLEETPRHVLIECRSLLQHMWARVEQDYDREIDEIGPARSCYCSLLDQLRDFNYRYISDLTRYMHDDSIDEITDLEDALRDHRASFAQCTPDGSNALEDLAEAEARLPRLINRMLLMNK